MLGLTATPIRKDGQQPIIFMQCGPIRYHVDAKQQAAKRPFEHVVVPRPTEFKLPVMINEKYERPPIQTVYAELAKDQRRNQLILTDVKQALKAKRSPVILTERKEHVAYFAEQLQGCAKNIIVLHGGMSKRMTGYKSLGYQVTANDHTI